MLIYPPNFRKTFNSGEMQAEKASQRAGVPLSFRVQQRLKDKGEREKWRKGRVHIWISTSPIDPLCLSSLIYFMQAADLISDSSPFENLIETRKLLQTVCVWGQV